MGLFKHDPFKVRLRSGHWEHLTAVSLMVAVLFFGAATTAQAAMSEKEIAQKVEKEFGIQVLHVEPVASNGPGSFAVTVMSPPGNRNSAYQVNTIVVDAATGNLMIQYGHGESMHKLPAPPVSERGHPLTELDR